jgi:hypothetical protein
MLRQTRITGALGGFLALFSTDSSAQQGISLRFTEAAERSGAKRPDGHVWQAIVAIH